MVLIHIHVMLYKYRLLANFVTIIYLPGIIKVSTFFTVSKKNLKQWMVLYLLNVLMCAQHYMWFSTKKRLSWESTFLEIQKSELLGNGKLCLCCDSKAVKFRKGGDNISMWMYGGWVGHKGIWEFEKPGQEKVAKMWWLKRRTQYEN